MAPIMARTPTPLTRRAFCVVSAAFAALSAHEVLAGVAPTDDSPLLELCESYLALNCAISDLWSLHIAEYDHTIAELGECPRGFDATWRTAEAHQQACDRQDTLMDQIVKTPAVTIAGVTAKLDLWRRTDGLFLSGNDLLWNSITEDLRLLSTVIVVDAPGSLRSKTRFCNSFKGDPSRP
jgi:hypothetical protein